MIAPPQSLLSSCEWEGFRQILDKENSWKIENNSFWNKTGKRQEIKKLGKTLAIRQHINKIKLENTAWRCSETDVGSMLLVP